MLRQTAAVCILLAAANIAEAQFNAGAAQRIQRPLNRPTVSPYLNLLRGGNGTGLNYYGLVRPELQFGQSLQQLQFGLGNLQHRGGSTSPFGSFAGGRGMTGHAVVFDSYRFGSPSASFGGLVGGSVGFNPGFLTGGSFGGLGFGGGNNSLSPINGGALRGANAGSTGLFAGQGTAAPVNNNVGAGGQAGLVGTSSGNTPWGRGLIVPASGHPAVFDSYRQGVNGQ